MLQSCFTRGTVMAGCLLIVSPAPKLCHPCRRVGRRRRLRPAAKACGISVRKNTRRDRLLEPAKARRTVTRKQTRHSCSVPSAVVYLPRNYFSTLNGTYYLLYTRYFQVLCCIVSSFWRIDVPKTLTCEQYWCMVVA